ncbi:MAG TPA: hypothetical protein VGP88_04015, partial [Thermoplasmata archaeon]|nr:hypothetical protein [Thermoplasmata archaeon]
MWATLGVVAAMVLVIPVLAATAGAAPVAAAGPTTAATLNASASQQWAYGGQKWVNVSLQVGNATYQSHAFFGWQVIYTATNTSNSTVELEAQRTMAADLFAQFNGSHVSGNLSVRGVESETGFANLSTTAQVDENGTPTSAIGLTNASTEASANLTESYSLSAGSHSASGHLNVQGSSMSAVSFAPSFGLVPWNVAPNVTWNSSAMYTASGSWSIAYQWANAGIFGTSANGSGNPSGSVTGTGTVSLTGADLGTVTLANGRTVPVIALAVTGPFDDVDGFILVPHSFEIFGAGDHAWAHGSLAAEDVATDRLDLGLDVVHHRAQVVATASSYQGTDDSLASSGSATMTTASSAPSPSTAVVQAQPESVPAAQHDAACLQAECHGASGAAGSVLPLLVVGLVVGLIAVAIIGTVGVVEYRAWSRRKSGGQLVGGYSQQVPSSVTGIPPPPQGPTPPGPPSGGA